MIFRSLQQSDMAQLQDLALASWLFTYKDIYSEENIRSQVADYYADEKLTKDVDKAESGEESFIVAEQDGKIVGYAQTTDGVDGWEVQRIYVDPTLHRKGIGKGLIDRVEEFLRAKHARSYIAHPHSDNPIAVNFYLKQGFVRYPEGDRGDDSPCFRKEL